MSSENDGGTDGKASQSHSPSKPLRRPHQTTENRLLNGSSDITNSPKKQTTLSADAPVFVPKFATQAPNLSITAAEFVPRNSYTPYTSHTQNFDNLHEDFQRLVSIPPSLHTTVQNATPSNDQVIEEFKSTLYELTIRPGEMEEVMRPMVEVMLKCTDSSIVSKIIELLFEQCITEPNFRYTGAKLCKFLCTELKKNDIYKSFRTDFLTRCKAEFLKKEELITDPNSVNRLCGFTMFIGELFLNLEVEVEGKPPMKVAILRIPVLRDLLLSLLSHPTDFTVKCAMQLLKLTGATIEDTADLNQSSDVTYDEVFLQIRALDTYPNLNQTSKCLIKSVLDLKDNNWGRSTSRTSASSVSTPEKNPNPHQYFSQPTYAENEAVFYNAQGQPMTAQEADYFKQEYEDFVLEQEATAYARWESEDLEDNQWEQGGVGYQPWSNNPEMMYNNGYYQGVTYDENYMDDEMEAAYEEFLRQQVQGHR